METQPRNCVLLQKEDKVSRDSTEETDRQKSVFYTGERQREKMQTHCTQARVHWDMVRNPEKILLFLVSCLLCPSANSQPGDGAESGTRPYRHTRQDPTPLSLRTYSQPRMNTSTRLAGVHSMR